MPFSAESFGTQKLVQLAPLLYSLTHGEQPSACFADEFDASIHPTLFAGILRHFNCEIEPSAVRGQLIFTAHETSLIDAEARDAVLRRDQVYLTDKDASGASRLYSIGEFRERNNVNLRKRYLEGRYGAIPSIGGFQK